MPAPRVLILSSQALFAESLRSLLQRDGCQVLEVRPYDESVPGLIEALKPTVVVLDTQDVPPKVTASLLDCAPNIRIVQVSLQGQLIGLYDHRQPPSTTVQEFLDLVAFRDKRPADADVLRPGQGEPPD